MSYGHIAAFFDTTGYEPYDHIAAIIRNQLFSDLSAYLGAPIW